MRDNAPTLLEPSRGTRLLEALPWLAILILFLPVLVRGFPAGHDWPMEVVRIAEFRYAVAHGQFPPWWADHLYRGYGAPVFIFYAPLYAATAAAASAVFGNFFRGALIALVLATVIGMWAMRTLVTRALLAERLKSPMPGRLAVYLYILSPYLACDALIRNANAEFIALCLLPLPLLGLFRIETRPERGIAEIGGGLALLVLAHNLTALVGITFLLVGAGVMFGRRMQSLVHTGGAIVLGLTLSAFFWIPAMRLKPLIHTDDLLTGKFDFHRQFQPVWQFFSYRKQDFYSLGVLPPLAWLAALIGFEILTRRRPGPTRQLGRVMLLGAFVAFGLQLEATTVLWENLPLLPFFQFPWRLMGPLAFGVAVALALAVGRILPWLPSRGRVAIEVFIFILAVANVAPRLYVTRAVPHEEQAQFSQNITPEQLVKSFRHRVTVGDEYLPKNANKRRWRFGRGPMARRPIGTVIRIQEDQARHIELTTRGSKDVRLLFRRWYLLGWNAQIDGQPAEAIEDKSGAVALNVPAGHHKVILHKSPPRLRQFGIAVSLLAAIFWSVLFFWRKPVVPPPEPRPGLRYNLPVEGPPPVSEDAPAS